MGGIRVSDKHGVNPSVEKCFVCGKDKGVIMFGKLPGDVEAPPSMVLPSKEPCDECLDYMGKGIILISVDMEKSEGDMQNPWRTGGWLVITEEGFDRIGIHPPELAEDIKKKRIAFLPDDAWDMLGLPRGEVEGVPNG